MAPQEIIYLCESRKDQEHESRLLFSKSWLEKDRKDKAWTCNLRLWGFHTAKKGNMKTLRERYYIGFWPPHQRWQAFSWRFPVEPSIRTSNYRGCIGPFSSQEDARNRMNCENARLTAKK